jgi:beta-lactamase regulating signal transducer with metallopeptidase domain
MWVWVDRTGVLLFDATLSTALFLSLMILATLICRQPVRRLLIARVALGGSLLMIPLVTLVPLPRLDLGTVLARSRIAPLICTTPWLDQTTASPAQANIAAPWAGAARSVGVPEVLGLVNSTTLQRLLTLLDVGGIAAGFAWLILGMWGVHWLIRHSDGPNSCTRSVYERLHLGGARQFRNIPLRISPRVQRPAVVGLLRPTILIPPSFDAESGQPEELRLSLLHELAHVEQSDHWHGVIANVAQTVWFLLPQVWWLRSQLRMDQEFLADRFAASRFGTASGYAASLLLLASSQREARVETVARDPGRAGLGSASAGPRSPLFQRLLMLLHCPFRIETRVPGLWSWGLQVSVIGLLLIAACVSVRWPAAAADAARALEAPTNRRAFRVADFIAEPLVFSPAHRALAYALPLVLPDHFDLRVEVFATRADLAQARIAGHLLGIARRATSASHSTSTYPADTESWHPVRLKRNGPELQLWADELAGPVMLNPELTSEVLTIEPGPGASLRFRKLLVEW